MATWKRLTQVSGPLVDVNMDQVAYLQKAMNSSTEIVFATSVDGKKMTIAVKESVEMIHLANPVESA
jgi:UDP-N-acetylglucosamine pyrophosphorylase